MPKALPTDKAAFKLVLRKITENKAKYNQSQLCIMLQAADRWAKVIKYYKVDLTPPTILYNRNPLGKNGKEEDESETPYAPKMTVEEAFGQIGGNDASAN